MTDWKSVIAQDISENKVVVYMRGSPDQPRCGFSARVTKVFNELGFPYKTRDMDSDPALWQTLSQLNNWPTSPQVYVNGEFIGGCDIAVELFRSGELKQMLDTTTTP